MTGMYIDEDGQPSSDEEDFVYAKYGGADEVLDDPYAEYKRRVMKEIYQSFEYSLKEEPDDLSYEEDSDL